jgi:hypothetical protein
LAACCFDYGLRPNPFFMKNKLLFLSLVILLFSFAGCKKENEIVSKPQIELKNSDYTQNAALVPLGGKLKFGITASSKGSIITNLRIQRFSDGQLTTELDKGLYSDNGNLEYEFNAVKSSAAREIWTFFIFNSNRDSAIISITINRGVGASWGKINYYPSIIIGMQSNTNLPNYLDLHTGNLFTKTNITGHESEIDLVGFVYTTSGILSPTLCCPGYTGSSSVTGHYPEIINWSIQNLTAYDYYSSDNNLVSKIEFDKAQNDSLLVSSFKPEKVSGLCKYCNNGRIVPFKTEDGKYGLVHVRHADLTETGYMELEIKIQK